MFDFAAFIESCLNGHITSIKFNGRTITLGKTHVIVFSNFTPEKDQFSEDR